MNGKKVTVVARFTAKTGMEEEMKKELLKLIAPSRSDDGCVNYDLHQGIENPAVFIFHENWQTREHLSRHSVMPHLQAFRAKVKDMLAEAPEVTLLEMISE
ncbi:MAG: putative quinol monooxygenase [Syntrophobacter sp.]